jgi:hypothetical protein
MKFYAIILPTETDMDACPAKNRYPTEPDLLILR